MSTIRCYVCNKKIKKKKIIYDNPLWGDLTKFRKEIAFVYMCRGCGEFFFDREEAERLQNLSKGYI